MHLTDWLKRKKKKVKSFCDIAYDQNKAKFRWEWWQQPANASKQVNKAVADLNRFENELKASKPSKAEQKGIG